MTLAAGVDALERREAYRLHHVIVKTGRPPAWIGNVQAALNGLNCFASFNC
jgi:hypothetical protein